MMQICRSPEFVTQLEGVVGGNQLEEGGDGDDSDEVDNDDTRRKLGRGVGTGKVIRSKETGMS